MVTSADANDAKGLRLRWWRLEFLFVGPDGHETVAEPTPDGLDMRPDHHLGVREAPGSRLFPLGERVTFSVAEFAELCFTCLAFGQDLTKCMARFAREKGIPITPPPKPETPPAA